MSAELIHAPDAEDVLDSAPLCAIEDPAASRSFTRSDVTCKVCLDILWKQPGTAAFLLETG